MFEFDVSSPGSYLAELDFPKLETGHRRQRWQAGGHEGVARYIL